MGLFNNIFKWFILDRMRQIEAFHSFPFEIQNKVWKDLILAGKDTEWGRKYRFDELKTYQEFRERIPIQDYNSLKPFIERMMQGEQNILWNTPVKWFAKSSGTTDDKSKFIPVSQESMDECHFKAGKDMYSLYYNMNPEANLVDGKTLALGGSHQVNQFQTDIFYGDLSAVLMQNLPFWAEMKRVPSLEIALMDNWEEKIEKMAQAIVNEPVTNMLGVPTWTVILIKRLFEMTGKDNLADIWPTLELYVHGGVSFTPYDALFNKLIHSDKIHFMETYNASEGFFAIQDQKGIREMLLMLDYGIFYEFIPLDDNGAESDLAIPLQEVELDKNYAVLISTNSGLWRYHIGDTIKFTTKDPYRMQISGRTKHFINAFGEELIVDNAERAISFACSETGSIVSDYTAAPVYFSENGNGAHEWLIEFEKEPADFQLFITSLDNKLKSLNSDYEAKRFKNIALRMPVVKIVPQGTFYKWMKERGKLGGQHKVPRLANERRFVEEILRFAGSELI